MNTEKFNIELLKQFVSTQYGDYGGLIQIDGHHSSDLFDMCGDNGIDMDNYFLIGFGFSGSDILGIGTRKTISCKAILLDKNEYGDSFDEIQKRILNEGRKVNAVEKYFKIELDSLSKYIKRFDFFVGSPMTNFISELNIENIG